MQQYNTAVTLDMGDLNDRLCRTKLRRSESSIFGRQNSWTKLKCKMRLKVEFCPDYSLGADRDLYNAQFVGVGTITDMTKCKAIKWVSIRKSVEINALSSLS